jgi:hypothetical protein
MDVYLVLSKIKDDEELERSSCPIAAFLDVDEAAIFAERMNAIQGTAHYEVLAIPLRGVDRTATEARGLDAEI